MKSKLNMSGSSAFFTYVKSIAVMKGAQVTDPNDKDAAKSKTIEGNPKFSDQNVINDAQVCENGCTWEKYCWGNQIPMPSSPSGPFQNNHPDHRNRASFLPEPRYNHLQQCHSHPHASTGMGASFPYYQVDRREAALIKFRQKKESALLRYANRKSLAETRTRVKGKFTRNVNNMTIDLNGQPASADEETEEAAASKDSSHQDGFSTKS
ncbi:two-component response regulator-like APRR1 [Hibiscus syriacus]|uniref:two-component response regulator-like APRR1 n=1 Tax=Hibiscus syriacus TaxID=106335 RepID=UPI0019239FCA|nr:two-component response regulator-like APRR1 [Hibiscus syriacus]